MPSEYKPRDLYASPLNPDRCKASVPYGGRSVSFHQCQRAPWKDGWCKQHHPDTEAERRKQSEERYQQKRTLSPLSQLTRAYEEIARQKRLVGELTEVLDAILDAQIANWFSYTKLPGKIEDAEVEAQKLVDRAYALLARHQKETDDAEA